MKQIKRVLKAVCSIWLCVLLAVFSYQVPVLAAVEVDAQLTAVELRDHSGVAMTEQTKGGYFQVHLEWKVLSTLHQGDFFHITVPPELDLTTQDTHPLTFTLKDEDENEIAEATITPEAPTSSGGGGNLKVVFNSAAEGKTNASGNIHFQAKFNENKVQVNQENSIPFLVNGRTDRSPGDTKIKVIPDAVIPPDRVIAKSAKLPNGIYTEARWQMAINGGKMNLKGVKITDTILTRNGTYFDPDDAVTAANSMHFYLRKVTYGSNPQVPDTWNDGVVDVRSMVTFDANKHSFTLDLGDIGTQGYWLEYTTSVLYGDNKQKNFAELTATNVTFANPAVTEGTWQYNTSGGGATENLANRLKIRKIDAETDEPIPGAKFLVKRDLDGTEYTLETQAGGVVVSGLIGAGDYTVKESVPPPGYELDETVYPVHVSATDGAVLNTYDMPKKVDITVKKLWKYAGGVVDFPAPVSSIEVDLYNNGVATDSTMTLDETNHFSDVFEEQSVVSGGRPNHYTVKERGEASGVVSLNGQPYDVQVTGSENSGFVVINVSRVQPPAPPSHGHGGGGSGTHSGSSSPDTSGGVPGIAGVPGATTGAPGGGPVAPGAPGSVPGVLLGAIGTQGTVPGATGMTGTPEGTTRGNSPKGAEKKRRPSTRKRRQERAISAKNAGEKSAGEKSAGKKNDSHSLPGERAGAKRNKSKGEPGDIRGRSRRQKKGKEAGDQRRVRSPQTGEREIAPHVFGFLLSLMAALFLLFDQRLRHLADGWKANQER
ncbi:MAG: Cna B-type domain-containing protein [Lachnospiraceae bacterium]|nr:Cna B-type domain-containing protein [Lachnospiraceae bacterium]